MIKISKIYMKTILSSIHIVVQIMEKCKGFVSKTIQKRKNSKLYLLWIPEGNATCVAPGF